MFTGLLRESRQGLLQETLCRMELLVGNHLLFMALADTLKSNPKFLGGVFNILHGPDAMALIVVVSD